MSGSMLRNFLISFSITLLLIIGTIIVCYAFNVNNTRRQNEKTAETSMTETVRRAEAILTTQKSMSEVVTNHNDVVRFLMGTTAERMELRDNVRSLLTNYVSFSSGAVMAYLYSAEGNWMSGTDSFTPESGFAFRLSRELADAYHLKRPFRSGIITDCYACDGACYYAVITPVFLPIAAPKLTDFQGSLILVYQADCLADALPSSGDISGFVHKNGVLLGGDQDAFKHWQQDADGSVRQKIAGTDWEIELVLNTDGDMENLRHMRRLCWIVALASLCAMSALTVVQYRRIVHPIMEIASQTAGIHRDGDLLVDHYQKTNELSRLVRSINDMLVRLNQLNEEILQVKMKYYEEQIAFFQAQINPHFLFNTFECIRGMASEGRMEEVRTATSCMAGIYRYCAAKSTLVPLQMEYDCLRQYMRVMTLRYGPVYELTLEGDEEALQCAVPRMCLQPLVENSVTHGFCTRTDRIGHIRLCSRLENGALHMTLQDDGDGMSEEKIAYYNTAEPVHIDGLHSHIGITNVVRRFHLLFQNQCRIRFSTPPGGGLKIEIEIDNT